MLRIWKKVKPKGETNMVEQLDMFYASAMESEKKVTEQDLQNAHDKKYQEPRKLTPRQWALLNLVKFNSQRGEKTTQRQIYEYCNGYEWNDDDTFCLCEYTW